MLDIKFIRENKKLVEKNNASRNVKVDIDKLLDYDAEYVEISGTRDILKGGLNAKSKTKPNPDQIKALREISDQVKNLEIKAEEAKKKRDELLIKFPNINDPSTPKGKDDTENIVIKTAGQKPNFAFPPQEHFEVERVKEGIDMERGAKTSGSRFYYLKGKMAMLERAIMQYAVDFMTTKGFELVLPPILVKEAAMYGTGFFPADKNEVYSVNPGEDNLYLIGTSEVPMIYLHADEVLDEKIFPKKYVAITPCFRRESGSYGKDTKGLFRVHQFYKAEMVVFASPDQSSKLHDELLKIEEEFIASLGLHYQVVDVCSGDLGFPAAKKYDCEGWFPGQGRYRELTSTSNTTDYQARRSNIKFKTKDGKRLFAHTLNGTVSSDRPMLAIVENNQQSDGSVLIPKVLQKYTGFEKI